MASSDTTTPSRKPRDGPALSFYADPYVEKIVKRSSSPHTTTTVGPEFGLVFVAGWPPNLQDLGGPYSSFLDSVRLCFDKEDIEPFEGESPSSSSSSNAPAVYLYPPEHLHVTVASLHGFAIGENDRSRREVLRHHWTKVVTAASKREEWPRKGQTLKLRISSAQIGTRAGILLWDETTGGIDAMRKCIADETAKQQKDLKAVGIDVDTLSIPCIIHSTFLRFHETPKTNGEVAQTKFQNLVSSHLAEFFPREYQVHTARLVCERTPYMHIPNDADHVLLTFQF